jgi:2-polyprenyl-6-methoxyphenol hydroxylase-like FAD-dependent oxidoreductase
MKEELDHVEVAFEDGSTYSGLIVAGCDGSQSRVRRIVFPENFGDSPIPVRLLGFTLKVTIEQGNDLYKMDPFFLQGIASESNVFMYISCKFSMIRLRTIYSEVTVLHAPQDEKCEQDLIYQICVSFRVDKPLINGVTQSSTRLAPEERVTMIKTLSQAWAELFRSFASLISEETEVKQLDLYDFPPRSRTKFTRSAIVMGDAAHAMTMYRGEGANHAIVDVLDFKEKIVPALEQDAPRDQLAHALSDFEGGVMKGTAPAVQVSRQACLDAHEWASLSPTSPLLTRRQMWLAQ